MLLFKKCLVNQRGAILTILIRKFENHYLLLDNRALVIETLENKIGHLLDDARIRDTQQFTDLLQFVHRRDLIFVRRYPIDQTRSPV
jgi:hypothetical protein